MTRLVVLDRDGVINHDSAAFIKNADEWRPIEGSLDAIARLGTAGFTVAVASNQSGIGRALLTERNLSSIHDKMRHEVARVGGRIDRVVYCPHLPDAGCDCRKPEPGLLRALGEHYGIELEGVPVVGDSLRDIEAAQAVGARPILVLTGNGSKTRQQLLERGAFVETFDDLAATVEALLEQNG